MKSLILSLVLALLSSVAMAEAPSAQMVRLTNALLNSPEVSEALRGNHSTMLTSFAEKKKNGVTIYELEFKNRPCMCLPSQASVQIVEDLRPTAYDGAPIYTSTIEVK